MRKNYFFAALLMLLFGAGNAMADSYKVDFETTVETSDHEFRVASGWSHIVDADISLRGCLRMSTTLMKKTLA